MIVLAGKLDGATNGFVSISCTFLRVLFYTCHMNISMSRTFSAWTQFFVGVACGAFCAVIALVCVWGSSLIWGAVSKRLL